MDLLRSEALKAFADVVQLRVCQLGRDGRDCLFRDLAEEWTREVSRERQTGHGDGSSCVRKFSVSRGAGKLDVDQGGLMPRDVLVLGVPDGISRVVRSTRGSSTAATGGTLNATSHLGLCVCKPGGGRGVFRVGSASKAGSFGGHDEEVGFSCTTSE